MPEILQASLPLAPWTGSPGLRLPGTVPIAPADWLQRDDVFAAQMALRDGLVAESPETVHAMSEGCLPAASELLAVVLEWVAAAPGYTREDAAVRRPDDVAVPLAGPPLLVAGRLVQEDLLILEKLAGADEHVLTGGILCFPSNWTLAEKFGRGLVRIHRPVERYDAHVARRVQRLFEGLRPEAPLMRANLIFYSDSVLNCPRREVEKHAPVPGTARFVRVERQVLLRLPVTRAVVFSIHTYMVRPDALTPEQREGLVDQFPEALAADVP